MNIKQALYKSVEQDVSKLSESRAFKLFTVDNTKPFNIGVFLKYEIKDKYGSYVGSVYLDVSNNNQIICKNVNNPSRYSAIIGKHSDNNYFSLYISLPVPEIDMGGSETIKITYSKLDINYGLVSDISIVTDTTTQISEIATLDDSNLSIYCIDRGIKYTSSSSNDYIHMGTRGRETQLTLWNDTTLDSSIITPGVLRLSDDEESSTLRLAKNNIMVETMDTDIGYPEYMTEMTPEGFISTTYWYDDEEEDNLVEREGYFNASQIALNKYLDITDGSNVASNVVIEPGSISLKSGELELAIDSEGVWSNLFGERDKDNKFCKGMKLTTSGIEFWGDIAGNIKLNNSFVVPSNGYGIGQINDENKITNGILFGSDQGTISKNLVNGISSGLTIINGNTYINGPANVAGNLTIAATFDLIINSDKRLKTNIEKLSTPILDSVLNTDISTFNYITSPNSNKTIGLMAQDLEQNFPEISSQLISISDSDDLPGKMTVKETKLVYVLWKALQEEAQKRKDLETKLDKVIRLLEGNING